VRSKRKNITNPANWSVYWSADSTDSGSVPMTSRSQPFTIASVAKTLAELKALPLADQAMLLLRRLVHIAPQVQRSGGLHKGNLLLPNDPYGLAAGFPANENTPVRQHLLGVPWTRLVNEGFLVDPSGSGFFSVSEDGLATVKNAAGRKVPVLAETADAHPDDDIPTAFISYSWDGPEHKDWVFGLAERLRAQGGVRVILDPWHLGPGEDRTHFMEESIRTSDFVLIVCTPAYATKANNRAGGVGYEAMIITSQLAQRIQQNKFIPVLRSGKWDDSSVPIWIQSKIGADLRGDPYKEDEYDRLLRALHRAHPKPPPVGPKPVFSERGASFSRDLPGNAVSAVVESVSNVDPPLGSTGRDNEDRPKLSPVAYAFYETKGADARRVQAFVRPTDATGQSFRFETSTGERLEGTETQVAQQYLAFDLDLRRKGFTRMQTFDGFGGPIFRLPS